MGAPQEFAASESALAVAAAAPRRLQVGRVGGYCKPPRKEAQRKTPRQLAYLEKLWAEGDPDKSGRVWKPAEIRDQMRAERDPQTGLRYFSRRPNNHNGAVLTEDTIKAWIAVRSNHAKKHGRGKVRDVVDFMGKEDLQEELVAACGSERAAWAAAGKHSKSGFAGVKVAELRSVVRAQLAAGVASNATIAPPQPST
eukprot:COSAG01_NODE_18455_length_1074_cov_14.540513_2_plen_197_part_00